MIQTHIFKASRGRCVLQLMFIFVIFYISTAGSDFILNSTNAMIPWTLSPPTIEVSIIDDNIVEQNETFMITLSVINNTRITTSISELKITIVDNGKTTGDNGMSLSLCIPGYTLHVFLGMSLNTCAHYC